MPASNHWDRRLTQMRNQKPMTIFQQTPGFVVGRFHSSFNPNSENPRLLLRPHVQRPGQKKDKPRMPHPDLTPVPHVVILNHTWGERSKHLGVPPNLSLPHLPSRVPTYYNPYLLHTLLTPTLDHDPILRRLPFPGASRSSLCILCSGGTPRRISRISLALQGLRLWTLSQTPGLGRS